MHRRKILTALATAVIGLGVVAVPAQAATGSVTDPANDVKTSSGATANEPRADITAVSLDNSPTSVTLTITAATPVPFSDAAWDIGDIAIVGAIEGSTTAQRYVWEVIPTGNGTALGLLRSTTTGHACLTDAAETSTGYVLTADPRCARGLPRSLKFGAVILVNGNGGVVSDKAPDGAFPPAVDASSAPVSSRLAGTDRTLTAIALSRDITTDGSATAAVLAASGTFPDALAGGPLATAAGGPLLLTGTAGLDPRVADELARAVAPGSTVYVLGGTAALSDKVVGDVRARGFIPKRVAGVDRFETATAIADEVDQLDKGHDTVLIADGMTFTDALVAGAAAPAVNGVVVLTNGSQMPTATADYLGADKNTHTAIGTAAAAAAAGVHHITGANPSELSANVARELSPIGGAVAVASQATFADALAGGSHISVLNGPLLLTDPQTLSPETAAAIKAASASLREVVIYGGTAAISPAVEDAIKQAMAG